MNEFKNFIKEYCGAIIGGIVAILILCTGFYKLIVGIIFVVLGIVLGNYIQKNKYEVKEKLKKIIDRM